MVVPGFDALKNCSSESAYKYSITQQIERIKSNGESHQGDISHVPIISEHNSQPFEENSQSILRALTHNDEMTSLSFSDTLYDQKRVKFEHEMDTDDGEESSFGESDGEPQQPTHKQASKVVMSSASSSPLPVYATTSNANYSNDEQEEEYESDVESYDESYDSEEEDEGEAIKKKKAAEFKQQMDTKDEGVEKGIPTTAMKTMTKIRNTPLQPTREDDNDKKVHSIASVFMDREIRKISKEKEKQPPGKGKKTASSDGMSSSGFDHTTWHKKGLNFTDNKANFGEMNKKEILIEDVDPSDVKKPKQNKKTDEPRGTMQRTKETGDDEGKASAAGTKTIKPLKAMKSNGRASFMDKKVAFMNGISTEPKTSAPVAPKASTPVPAKKRSSLLKKKTDTSTQPENSEEIQKRIAEGRRYTLAWEKIRDNVDKANRKTIEVLNVDDDKDDRRHAKTKPKSKEFVCSDDDSDFKGRDVRHSKQMGQKRKREYDVDDAETNADEGCKVDPNSNDEDDCLPFDVCPLPPVPQFGDMTGHPLDMSMYKKNENIATRYEKGNKMCSIKITIDGVYVTTVENVKPTMKLKTVCGSVLDKVLKCCRQDPSFLKRTPMETGANVRMFVNGCTRDQTDTIGTVIRDTQRNDRSKCVEIDLETLRCKVTFFVVRKENRGKPVEMFKAKVQVGTKFSKLVSNLMKTLEETEDFRKVLSNCCIYYRYMFLLTTTEDPKWVSKFDYTLSVHHTDMKVHMYPAEEHLCVNVQTRTTTDAKPKNVFPVWKEENLLLSLRDKFMSPKGLWICENDYVIGETDEGPVKANGLILRAKTATVRNVVRDIARNYNRPTSKKRKEDGTLQTVNNAFCLVGHFMFVWRVKKRHLALKVLSHPFAFLEEGFGLGRYPSLKSILYDTPISTTFNTYFGENFHEADVKVVAPNGSSYSLSLSSANNGVPSKLVQEHRELHLVIALQRKTPNIKNPYFETIILGSTGIEDNDDDDQNGGKQPGKRKVIVNANVPSIPVVLADKQNVKRDIRRVQNYLANKEKDEEEEEEDMEDIRAESAAKERERQKEEARVAVNSIIPRDDDDVKETIEITAVSVKTVERVKVPSPSSGAAVCTVAATTQKSQKRRQETDEKPTKSQASVKRMKALAAVDQEHRRQTNFESPIAFIKVDFPQRPIAPPPTVVKPLHKLKGEYNQKQKQTDVEDAIDFSDLKDAAANVRSSELQEFIDRSENSSLTGDPICITSLEDFRNVIIDDRPTADGYSYKSDEEGEEEEEEEDVNPAESQQAIFAREINVEKLQSSVNIETINEGYSQGTDNRVHEEEEEEDDDEEGIEYEDGDDEDDPYAYR